MQHIEKTSAKIGQVSDKRLNFPMRWIQFIKCMREETIKKQKQTDMLSALTAIRIRRDTIRRNLNAITDTECAEIAIYQLKAADLDYNRHIRMAKNAVAEDIYFGEEPL